MRDMPSYRLKERNPATRAAHQRQVLWQITAPLIGGMLVILALVAFTMISAMGGGAAVSRWADISLIWLLIPNLVLIFIFTLIVAALIYGLVKLIGVLPQVAYEIQEFLAALQARLKAIADSLARPVIQVGGFWAAVRALFGK